MRVREAKALAWTWIHEHGVAIAGFSGAILSGSINGAKEEDPWPSTSDVDIAVFVAGDTDTGFPREYSKFFYNGLILEVSLKPIDRIQSAEQILADYVLACSFSADSILSDPTGKLAELHDAVACHYRAPHWIVARCERAKQDVLEQWLPWMIQSESLYENAFGFGMTVMEIALIPVLADLRPPTVRKALVIAQQVLRKHGQLNLYEDLLSLVGSATWTQADILAVLHDYEIAFDKATQVFHTPFWGRFGIGAAARPIFIEGTRELIDLGYGRETAVFVLGGHTVSQMVLENDALEEEKPYYRNLYRCFLARLGIHSSQDIRDRAEPARHLLQRSMQVANIIGTCHAGIQQ